MNFSQFFTFFIFPSWSKSFRLIILTILSIACATALIVSIFNSNDSILEQFKYSNQLIQGKKTASLKGLTPTFSEKDLGGNFLKELNYFEYTPLLEVKVFDKNTKQLITLLGVDLLNDYRFRDYAFEQAKPNLLNLIDPLKGGLILSKIAKEKLNCKNDTLDVLYGNSQIPFKISSEVSLKNIGLAQVENGLIALADIKYLQKILFLPNTFSSLDFTKANLQELKTKLNLPSGFEIIDPSSRRQEIENLTEAFRFNLQALSFIALFVSAYLIFQTIFISFQRKNKTIGILKVLGMSQKQIFILIMLEAFLLGLIGIILGCLLGLILSKFVFLSLQKTINELYFSTQSAKLLFSPKGLIIGSSIGLITSLIAGLPTAIFSTKVSPAFNLQEMTFRNFRFLSNNKLYLIYALGAFLLVFLFSVQNFLFTISNRYLGFAMALVLLIGLSLIAGFILFINLKIYSHLQNWFTKLFAVRLSINFIRLWIATGALICGLSMTISINIMIDSFRDTVKNWVNDTLKADIYISSIYKDNGANFDENLINKLSKIAGIQRIDYLSKHQSSFNNKPFTIGGANLTEQINSFKFIEALPNLKEIISTKNNFIIISNTFAIKHKLKLNSQIKINTLLKPQLMTIVGIYQDYSSEHGYILMRRDIYTKLFNNFKINNIALYLASNADENIIYAQLPPNLKVQKNAELRKTVLNIFDQTFQISYLFFWIAIIISILTVSLTLFSCIEENAYLNQIKYYLGNTLGQIFIYEFMQGLSIVLIALSLSSIGGYWLAHILKNTINNNSFGWIIYLYPNTKNILSIASLAIIGALIGTILPLMSAYKNPNMTQNRDGI